MIGSGGIAALVRAFMFALVDQATGETVMELGPQTSPLDGFGLSMPHGRDDITPSLLYWSHTPEPPGPPTSPSAYTELVGPNASGWDAAGVVSLRDELGTSSATEMISPRLGLLYAIVAANQNAALSQASVMLAASAAAGSSTLEVNTNGDITLTPKVRTMLAGRRAELRVYSSVKSATAQITVGTTVADSTGCTLTVPLLTGDTVDISGVFDFSCEVAANVVCVGYLSIGGALQGEQAVFQVATAVARATVTQTWKYTAVADGNVIFKLRANKTAAAGTYRLNGTHTRIAVEVFSTK